MQGTDIIAHNPHPLHAWHANTHDCAPYKMECNGLNTDSGEGESLFVWYLPN